MARSLRTSPQKVRLAIFDIDGTIFRSSLIVELFNGLISSGIFPRIARIEVEKSYTAWLNRKGHYNDYLMTLVGVFYKRIAGCSVRRVESAVKTVIAQQKDRVHRYARQLIRDLRKKNYRLLVISNSPEPIVKCFSTATGFSRATGHVLETANGVYTGRSIVDDKLMPGYAFIDKVSVLERFIKSSGLRVDLAHSVMIGDSEGDLPLLSYVGCPIAFNPSSPLARVAKRRGWPIVVERKDVVYRIHNADLVPVQGQKPKVPYGQGRVK